MTKTTENIAKDILEAMTGEKSSREDGISLTLIIPVISLALKTVRQDGWDEGYASGLKTAAEEAREVGRSVSKGLRRVAGPNDQGEFTAKQILDYLPKELSRVQA